MARPKKHPDEKRDQRIVELRSCRESPQPIEQVGVASVEVECFLEQGERLLGVFQALLCDLGHALESATQYRRWTHGEAIAIGMCAATDLAVGMGRCAKLRSWCFARKVDGMKSWPAILRNSIIRVAIFVPFSLHDEVKLLFVG